MTLDKLYDLFNFLVDKFQSAYFSPPEFDLLMDRAQMALFNSYYIQFSTSQRLNDALSPFKRRVTFANIDTPAGLYTVPADYLHLLSIYTIIQNPITSLPQNRPVPILNEDEKVWRDNSQIIPVTISDPYAVIVQNRNIQLYPATPQAGVINYLARPVAPVYGYSIISGRVISYNSLTSTQLEWAENDIMAILVKALSYAGVNLTSQEIMQWSEMKDQQNIDSPKNKA